MKDFMKKLTSRKFITCVAGVIMGLCMVFGLDENAITGVAGAVTALASIITYIYTEGKVDAVAVKEAVEKVEEATNAVEKIEE